MFSANSSQVSNDKLFVEDVFSTWLYTGTGAAQTITNGIDLAGKGGLVWTKLRDIGALNHSLFDTNRGVNLRLLTNLTSANTATANSLTAFNSNGFNIGSSSTVSQNTGAFASWTFRKAPKFFDVVTYTGDGTNSNRRISHNLGSEPGCIIVKRTDSTSDWVVYHRSLPATTTNRFLMLNSTSEYDTSAGIWGTADPTSTDFGVGSSSAKQNMSDGTYVAYLYAHDAASDGIIQCGSFTTNGSGVADVTLGWEPQWVMIKRTDTTGNWTIYDNMRGMPVSGYGAELYPNTAGVEALGYLIIPTATGFSTNLPASATYIYMAIRRGPMRTPTLGTSVYNANNVTTASYSVGFPSDMAIEKRRSETFNFGNGARLMGGGFLSTNTTNAFNSFGVFFWDEVTGNFRQGADDPACVWSFRRAPGFFDVVCYTGDGSVVRAVTHGLGARPELLICKNRTTSENWYVQYQAPESGGIRRITQLRLNTTEADLSGGGYDGYLLPTVFYAWDNGAVLKNNTSGSNYVAYLFASAPGVSKVGNYTGNGSSQTINCAFAAGARFVMIKRTDSTGDWYVWDTARGIVSGNDPHLSLNTTAAEVTSDDTIDPDSSGFVVNQVAATNVNVSSATYIYLAIA